MDNQQSNAIPALQRVRSEFVLNRFLGWYTLLSEFSKALDEKRYEICEALLQEVFEGGYEFSPGEQVRLIELQGLIHYCQGDILGLSTYFETLLLDNTALTEATAHFWLGMIHQHRGECEDAGFRYLKSKHAWEKVGYKQAYEDGRDMEFSLEEQKVNSTPPEIFQKRWKSIASGTVDAELELKEMARAALMAKDWRRGCEAVVALEHHKDVGTLALGLNSPAAPVCVATVASLRRVGVRLCERTFITALNNTHMLVRWQAAIALREATSNAADSLVDTLKREKDTSVLLAAAESLGQVGKRPHIPALRALPDKTDVLGERLSLVAARAIGRIEGRYPPPPALVVRSDKETRAYIRGNLINTAIQLAVGATLLTLVDVWIAAGYVLYALFAKAVIEPGVAKFNFFADKPCYTGHRKRVRYLSKTYTLTALMYLPLSLFPSGVYLLLLFHAFSWWVLIVPPLVILATLLSKQYIIATKACHYCTARERCPLWNRSLEQVYRVSERSSQ